MTDGTIDTVYADGKDVIVKVGKGSILLKDAYQETVTIVDAKGNSTSKMYGSLLVTGTAENESISNTWTDDVTIQAGAGDDTISNRVSKNVVNLW